MRGVRGEGETACFNNWGVGSGSLSGYCSSMRASAISRGEGVVVVGTPGECAIEMLKWVGVGDSGVCGGLPVLAGRCDGSDVDKIAFDNAVGFDKGGLACSCSDDGGTVGYGVTRLVNTGEYSDATRLLVIVNGTGGEGHSTVVGAAVVPTEVGVLQRVFKRDVNPSADDQKSCLLVSWS